MAARARGLCRKRIPPVKQAAQRRSPLLRLDSTPKVARTIAVANRKGGVGKTTTAVNLGAALAERGQRVLLLDLDPQGHLTINMGVKVPDELGKTIYDLLVDPGVSVNEVVADNQSMGVHFIPANIELAGAESQLMNEIGREGVLKEKLEPVRRRYDFVVIDCPPSLNLLTINAFVASDEVIIPLQCEYFGMKGMQQLLNTVDRVKAKLNPKLRVAGILPTIFKARTLHSQELLLEAIQVAKYPDRPRPKPSLEKHDRLDALRDKLQA